MDFLLHYGIILWLTIASICVVVGLILTFAKPSTQKRLPASAWREPPTSRNLASSASTPETARTCPACGQPIDDDEACFCWFCGAALASIMVTSTATARRQMSPTTVLVDKRALEQEIRQEKHGKHARWRYIPGKHHRRETSCP